jgi:tetraacyldisaccharide 4'-kinase
VPLRVTNGSPQAGETGMRLVPEGFYRLAAPDTRVAAGQFPAKPVHAVAGIGRPQRFFAALRELGLTVIPHPFPDHHGFRPADLDFGDDRPVLMTEKDAVKCLGFAGPNTWALAVRAEPEAGLAGTILQQMKEISVGQKTA